MSDDTSVPDSEQPITVDDVRRWAEDMECDVTPVDRAWDIAAFALHLASENEALRAQVAAHEDADRRWSADMEALRRELQEERDYRAVMIADRDARSGEPL